MTTIVGDSIARVILNTVKKSRASELKNGGWDATGDLSLVLSWMALLELLPQPYKRRELPKEYRRRDFHAHYCEVGPLSAFVSSRGASGNRRFFTEANADALDRALSRIRFWWKTGRIEERTRCLLTACLLDGLEKVANTQGTYHDFPRSSYDPRSFKPLIVPMPDPESLLSGPPAIAIGKSMDSLEFIKEVPEHDVLYLDPPYNFRQYTAYYFLPNLVAKYAEIENLDEYFERIQFVRGQNMESDFTSTFCSSKKFISSLEQLVRGSKSKYVILSYFNGKNHWHEFKSGTSDRGRQEIERFFSSELFEPGTIQCHLIARTNYQSYGGHKALDISEYVFVAQRKVKSRNFSGNKESSNAVA
ncbi:DNA adenine methylase [Xanthomonas arboricola]